VSPFIKLMLITETCVQIWQGLGGRRPQVLKEVELQLWQVILHLAQSASGDTVAVLKSVFEKIDAFLGEGVDVADIDWFDSGK
jgi:hypothetical protein